MQSCQCLPIVSKGVLHSLHLSVYDIPAYNSITNSDVDMDKSH